MYFYSIIFEKLKKIYVVSCYIQMVNSMMDLLQSFTSILFFNFLRYLGNTLNSIILD